MISYDCFYLTMYYILNSFMKPFFLSFHIFKMLIFISGFYKLPNLFTRVKSWRIIMLNTKKVS